MRLLLLLSLSLWSVAFGGIGSHRRRPLAKADMDREGENKNLFEYMFVRDWFFEQTFTEPGTERWRQDGT